MAVEYLGKNLISYSMLVSVDTKVDCRLLELLNLCRHALSWLDFDLQNEVKNESWRIKSKLFNLLSWWLSIITLKTLHNKHMKYTTPPTTHPPKTTSVIKKNTLFESSLRTTLSSRISDITLRYDSSHQLNLFDSYLRATNEQTEHHRFSLLHTDD